MGVRRERKREITLELETKEERDRRERSKGGRVKTGEEGEMPGGSGGSAFQHKACTSQFLSLPGCGTVGRSPDLPLPWFAHL